MQKIKNTPLKKELNQEFNKIISERIIELRKERGLTMEKLAYQSGISKGGLSEIERCLKSPMPFTISEICAGLDISIKDFFDTAEFSKFTDKL